ncbi:hypothetical protein EON67_01670 [archaeon]|nr:MAG: hypothetical protein EON67_01670 [archaeon]
MQTAAESVCDALTNAGSSSCAAGIPLPSLLALRALLCHLLHLPAAAMRAADLCGLRGVPTICL